MILHEQLLKIEGKYLPFWKERKITINCEKGTLQISYSQNKTKSFDLNTISITFGKNQHYLKIKTKQGRTYTVNSNDKQKTGSIINLYHQFKNKTELSNNKTNGLVKQQPQIYQIVILENNEYTQQRSSYQEQLSRRTFIEKIQQTFSKLENQKENQIQNKLNQPIFSQEIKKSKQINQNQFKQMKLTQQKLISEPIYYRVKAHINQKYWSKNPEGGLLWLDIKHQANIKKVLVWLIKKVFKSGTFHGISLPVYVMKSESILQSYAKSFGTAPIFLQGLTDKIQRIKYYSCFLFALSLDFTDLYKPFNPILGETFEGSIKGQKIYCQQIIHHPPVSAILFYGKGYRIYGSIQLDARLGFNQAHGIFFGELIIQFDDKTKIRAKILKGTLKNTVFGTQKFCTNGNTYLYDQTNNIVANYAFKQKDMYVGYIGQLNKQQQQQFKKQLQYRERFYQSKRIKKQGFKKIYSKLECSWTNYVKFDNIEYSNYQDPKYLPYKLDEQTNHLPSHSNLRKDIYYMCKGQQQKAQIQKQLLEQLQRNDRKLREKYIKRNS